MTVLLRILRRWEVICLLAGLLVLAVHPAIGDHIPGSVSGILFLAGLLSFITGLFALGFRFTRFLAKRLFHRVRSKIVATYLLTGVLPLGLITVLFILLLQAFLVQLASYQMDRALRKEFMGLESAYLREISGMDGIGRDYPGFRFVASPDDSSWVFAGEPSPGVLPPDSSRMFYIASEDTVFMAVTLLHESPVTVAAPLTGSLRERLQEDLGGEFIYTRGIPDLAGEEAPGEITVSLGSDSEISPGVTFALAPEVATDIETWLDTQPGGWDYLTAYTLDRGYLIKPGEPPGEAMILGLLRTRFSFTAGRVMQGALPENLPMQKVFMWLALGLGVIFGAIELVALIISLVLSRSITRTIAQLHRKADCVADGDFSYRIDSKRTDQLGLLASSFDRMSDSLEELLEKEKEKERLERDIAIAREVQGMFFPVSFPKSSGITMLGRCLPARMVSGDYYDCITHPEGCIDFFIGDICGKGIAAALLMAASHTFLRSEAVRRPLLSLPEIIAGLNDYLVRYSAEGKFSTLFYGRLDPEKRTLTYCNGGHPPPLLFRKGGVTELKAGGIIPGVVKGSRYLQETITLESGDLLAAFTDGFTEVFDGNDLELGEARLAEKIAGSLDESLEEIVRRLVGLAEGWSASGEQTDDMTIFLVGVE